MSTATTSSRPGHFRVPSHGLRSATATAVMTLAVATLTVMLSSRGNVAAGQEMAGEEFFERKVRPLLAEHCYSCHGKGQKKGGLTLDSAAGLHAGGDGGAVVVAGKPDESVLLRSVRYEGDYQMPPSGRISAGEVAILKQWIAMGTPWPQADEAESSSGNGIRDSGVVSDADRKFWSFIAPRRHPLPAVQRGDWSRSTIDHFILQRLEAEKLLPVAAADRTTLVRRASFDLLGLPPTAELLEQFALRAAVPGTTVDSDLDSPDAPDAHSRLVDRLLASPFYGERWGRHWLDVARYGEDQAHTFQARTYPNGYEYRDWVVRSLNEDLPYKQFVFDQVAGDLAADNLTRLPALGYFALGPVYYADAGCAPKALADEIDDRVDTLTRGFLGLTASCARCHDHKFDPITMRDYYGLAGVFASSKYQELPLVPAAEVQRFNDATARAKEQEKKIDDFQNAATRRLSESWAPQLSRWLVAGWQLQNQRNVDAKTSPTKLAMDVNAPEFAIDAIAKSLASDLVAKRPAWEAWRQAVAGQDKSRDWSTDQAVVDKVTAVAGQLQTQLEQALAKRRELDAQYDAAVAQAADEEAKKKVAKPQLDKPLTELLQDLLYDGKSPLFVPREQLEKLADDSVKTELSALKQELEARRKAIGPKYPFAHGLAEGDAKNVKIHLRGNHATLGEEAPRRFLEVLSAPDAPLFARGSGRLELAQALASESNPLTARVMVNRVWMHHFGQGLVGTPSNFGLLGQRPSHPELLDDLTVRFVESGWSLKWLHRELMLSATWQLGASFAADQFDRDPDNRWYWRMNRRRLDIEAWRDAVLASVGSLDQRLGGPPSDLNDGSHRRRTLYSRISRHELNSMLRLFDFPDPNLTSERRVTTTVPMQQLFVLNSDFMVRQAQALVARLDRAGTQDPIARVDWLYQWVLGRRPSDEERRVSQEFVAAASAEKGSRLPAWVQFGQLLLSTNEFVFVD